MEDTTSKPLLRKDLKSSERNKKVVISRERIWQIEKRLPTEKLWKSVLELEGILKEKNRQHKIKNWEDDIKDLEDLDDQFPHILEHAIIDVVNNNISAGQMSSGHTYNRGVNPEKSLLAKYNPQIPRSQIGHFQEIELQLAPVIPGHLQQEYVDRIISEIELQFKKTNDFDLKAIRI